MTTDRPSLLALRSILAAGSVALWALVACLVTAAPGVGTSATAGIASVERLPAPSDVLYEDLYIWRL